MELESGGELLESGREFKIVEVSRLGTLSVGTPSASAATDRSVQEELGGF